MCTCPEIIGTDDGNPIITAIERNWIELGGVVVAHCRRTREGALKRTNSVAMYRTPFQADIAATVWRHGNRRLVETPRQQKG